MNAGQIYSSLVLGSCINIWRTFTYVTEPTSNVYVFLSSLAYAHIILRSSISCHRHHTSARSLEDEWTRYFKLSVFRSRFVLSPHVWTCSMYVFHSSALHIYITSTYIIQTWLSSDPSFLRHHQDGPSRGATK